MLCGVVDGGLSALQADLIASCRQCQLKASMFASADSNENRFLYVDVHPAEKSPFQ